MKESQSLLAEYVQSRSEEVFGRLMKGYVDLVYSTALRLVRGDSHLAEDVAQTVFLRLAKRAGRLPPEVMLGGWLHQTTCFVAARMLRSERPFFFRL
jgi:DNA-directed RNA polymerase specialized sigma24 family protein